MYTIKRECYNDKTYNGFIDNPYWLITFDHYTIGLKDDGWYWEVTNNRISEYAKEMIQIIVDECKLNIRL